VQWRGVDISSDPLPLRTDLAYVGHSDGIKLELTAVENLQVARALSARPGSTPPPAILDALGLAGLAHVICRHLSAGQRRRLAIGRLLVGPAKLWILDEPFTALDAESSAAVRALLASHLTQGGLAVLSSHQPIDIVGFPIMKIGL
jgi:heme exporter protein A